MEGPRAALVRCPRPLRGGLGVGRGVGELDAGGRDLRDAEAFLALGDGEAGVARVPAQLRGGVLVLHELEAPARELFPDGFQDLSSKPNFLFFVVQVPPSATGSGS